MASESVAPVIDSHIHVWSDGADWAPGTEPQKGIEKAAQFETFRRSALEQGVAGALIVANSFPWSVHSDTEGWDHSYVVQAMEAFPEFYKATGIVSSGLQPSEAVAVLQRLSDAGFVGVRINVRDNWEASGDGPMAAVSRAVFIAAGELGMVVGFVCYLGIPCHRAAVEELLRLSPQTKVVVDHFGFFRQAGKDDEEAFDTLLALAQHPQLHVKVSAWMRISAMPGDGSCAYADLIPRIERVVNAFTSKRTLWGSDTPYALLGGQMPPGHSTFPSAIGTTYQKVCDDATVLFANTRLTREEKVDVLGRTATSLYWGAAAVPAGASGEKKRKQ